MDQTDTDHVDVADDVLAAEEREALRVALEMGYFEVPRAATLVEVADELGSTDAEVSRRLRLGLGTLLCELFVPPAPAARTDDAPESNALDRLFDALGDARRRRVLRLLLERTNGSEDAVPVDELVDGDDDPRSLAIALSHAHVPRLADSGYVEWDGDRDAVRRGPNFDEVVPLLLLVYGPNGVPAAEA